MVSAYGEVDFASKNYILQLDSNVEWAFYW